MAFSEEKCSPERPGLKQLYSRYLTRHFFRLNSEMFLYKLKKYNHESCPAGGECEWEGHWGSGPVRAGRPMGHGDVQRVQICSPFIRNGSGSCIESRLLEIISAKQIFACDVNRSRCFTVHFFRKVGYFGPFVIESVYCTGERLMGCRVW